MLPAHSKKIVIVKAGHKLPSLARTTGDFEQWIISAMGRSANEFMIIEPQTISEYPLNEQLKAVLITGSSSMVTEQSDWIRDCATWLGEVSGLSIPVLGICFGHQLLAHALGGMVNDNPAGVEVGTQCMRVLPAAKGDQLFDGLSELPVQTSHKQAVLKLPDGASRLATTDRDSNHAFRFRESVWGVQFHPEFSLAVTRHYIRYYQDKGLLKEEPQGLLDNCDETPQAAAILSKFSNVIGN